MGVDGGLVGRTAADLAQLVRSRRASAADVVRAHLEHVDAVEPGVGAFEVVRAEKALAEADAVVRRSDLSDLPLAGVPIAVKGNLPVAGEPVRHGSLATPAEPSAEDHEVVRRARAAGAVVMGITRMPELGLWGTSDGATGVARNPWDSSRTAGGSSGGSAAAVAAGMVALAIGNDGLGSIRIPAAACGLVGVKPGPGVVPSGIGRSGWYGLSVNGPLATTVDDAALLLSVMAGRVDLRWPRPPDGSLRVAVSTRAPAPGIAVDPEIAAVVLETADRLVGVGHRVTLADPPLPLRQAPAMLARWFAGASEDAEGLNRSRLQPRTRTHLRIGDRVRRLGLVRPEGRERARRAAAAFFGRHDLLLTPALAVTPIAADRWSARSWAANLVANARFAPFAAAWNVVGYPAAAVPAGRHSDGLPLSVQLVASDGDEEAILAVAKQLEELHPWPRTAPRSGA